MPATIEVDDVEKDFLYMQGIQRGVQRGMFNGLCKGLILAIEAKYGSSASEMGTMLEQVKDLNELEKIYEALKSSPDLDELKHYLINTQSTKTVN